MQFFFKNTYRIFRQNECSISKIGDFIKENNTFLKLHEFVDLDANLRNSRSGLATSFDEGGLSPPPLKNLRKIEVLLKPPWPARPGINRFRKAGRRGLAFWEGSWGGGMVRKVEASCERWRGNSRTRERRTERER